MEKFLVVVPEHGEAKIKDLINTYFSEHSYEIIPSTVWAIASPVFNEAEQVATLLNLPNPSGGLVIPFEQVSGFYNQDFWDLLKEWGKRPRKDDLPF